MDTPGTGNARQGKTPPGNARQGKYCPRCQTMTFRERETCAHCGHRFRTGLEPTDAAELAARIPDEAALHRTMQFTLPPLPPRGGPAPTQTVAESRAIRPRRLFRMTAVTGILLGLALLGAWVYVRHSRPAPAAASPTGAWETMLAGQGGAKARLRLVFQEKGDGLFSWKADGSPPLSGRAPLRWRVNADGRLVLTIPPPAPAEAVSGTLIAIFNSRPWPWRVDHAGHRLVLGSLTFQEN